MTMRQVKQMQGCNIEKVARLLDLSTLAGRKKGFEKETVDHAIRALGAKWIRYTRRRLTTL